MPTIQLPPQVIVAAQSVSDSSKLYLGVPEMIAANADAGTVVGYYYLTSDSEMPQS